MRLLSLVGGKKEEQVSKEMKILYVQPRGFGDIIMSTSIIRALKKKYPKTEIDYQCENSYKEILRGNPFISKIYSMEDKIDFEQYFQVLRPYIRTQKISDWHKLGIHMVDLYALYAGVKLKEYSTYIYIEPIDLKKIGIDKNKKWICIHPKSSDPMKDWPYFSDLIDLLKRDYGLILIGSKEDKENINYHDVIDLRGKVTLQQLAFIIKKCSLLVGVDSLGVHMAASLGVPTIILYGNTNANLCKPLSSDKVTLIEPYRYNCKVACHSGKCTQEDWCIKNIKVEKVFNAVNSNLKNGN